MIRQTLGELLVETGVVTKQQIEAALAYQAAAGKPLGEIMVELGFLTEGQLIEGLASQQHVESWDLRSNPPDPEALSLISGEYCVDHHLIPVKVQGESLIVAMRNPGDLEIIDRLSSVTKMRIIAAQASDTALSSILQRVYGNDPVLRESVDSFVSKALSEMGIEISEVPNGDPVKEEETRPVIGLVDQIITDAIAMGASDIHIEPREKRVELRYRINGRLVHIREIPSTLIRMVVARIKIMADLDITIRRHPQDGRIEFRRDRITTDLRVSCLPTQYGSRVVMRVLDRSVAIKKLDELGFNATNAKLFRKLITKPYGIVLVTGPTGSGKTTTLYAAINEIKDTATNFMTCEDPIEYSLDGVNQSQVDEKSGLTFAAQLRAILRQDPDAILVGEIRDGETAETAMRAAMTGHLVLSTLHCNDAPGAIPRLVNMGIDPFMLSTCINGVVAQRLLRVLCPECKVQREPSSEDLDTLNALGALNVQKVWEAVGCEVCHKTGYAGRIAVHEVLPFSEHVAALVAKADATEAIRAAASVYGYRPMGGDALDRVLAGQTTLSEARRLVAFDDFERVDEGDVPPGGLLLAG
ncbi:MAG TPA: ATPase, T2SS/T4P/T4SS family [Fimbriimonadaceae bacterium]|nr:ATPase, T2SS/T4P/T4SS family [Fimbriimonadaceae bacterium]